MQPTPQQTIDDLQKRLAKLRGQVRDLQRAGKIVQRETKAAAVVEDKAAPIRRKLKEQQDANAARVDALTARQTELSTELRNAKRTHSAELRERRDANRGLDRKRQALEQEVKDKDREIRNLQSKLAAAVKNTKALRTQLREQTDLSATLQSKLAKLRKDKQHESKKETRTPTPNETVIL
jgi:chromosome segregation ATPase